MSAPALSAFACDVAEGLARPRKPLPPRWLYDSLGSALFEAITLLPEYGLTRADAALIECSAHEIVAAARAPQRIVELGSGSGSITRHILAAAAAYGPVEYVPIDISGAALEGCRAALVSLPGVSVQPVEADYLEGLDQTLDSRRTLILFLGSTIGNFTPPESEAFLRAIRRRAHPGVSLLLGADLVKDPARLVAAYDDSLGVTAAFNLNLLARINRELLAGFRLDLFAHEARYDEAAARIEMHLRSRVGQNVRISVLDLEISFAEGETIWTESSHKFTSPGIRKLGESAGWQTLRQWTEHAWGFSETLFECLP